MTDQLWDDTHRIVFIDKARQMYVSTICCLIIDWYCTFVPDREVVVSRVKEESAIKPKVNTRKPEWLRSRVGMSTTPERVITYGCSGSTVTAVAQNFGVTRALVQKRSCKKCGTGPDTCHYCGVYFGIYEPIHRTFFLSSKGPVHGICGSCAE